MDPQQIFEMKQALAQRMALQRLLGGGDPGLGNPYPGTSRGYPMIQPQAMNPTAMSDSGSVLAGQDPGQGMIRQAQPDPNILYRLMQMFGQPQGQGQVM